MMSIRLHFIFLFSLLALGASAQSDSLKVLFGKLGNSRPMSADTSLNPQAGQHIGEITIVADSSITRLEKNTRGFRETKGYRIQVFLGSVDLAKSERNKYLSLGLPYSAYLKQVVPEMALQIGDFTTRMEMEKNLEIIRKYYPKAFPVVDVIEPPKFGKDKKAP
jgi:hypothetical protein